VFSSANAREVLKESIQKLAADVAKEEQALAMQAKVDA
jgi:hypothetical protein